VSKLVSFVCLVIVDSINDDRLNAWSAYPPSHTKVTFAPS